MAEIWKPQEIEVYRSWVNAIIDEAQDSLNDWESSFVDSIGNQLMQCIQLSEKQADILERIYTEKTS